MPQHTRNGQQEMREQARSPKKSLLVNMESDNESSLRWKINDILVTIGSGA